MSWGSCTKVYEGHGNVLTFVPYADTRSRELLDMSGVTEVRVCVGSSPVASSTLNPTSIVWEQEDPLDADSRWLLRLKLGLLPNLVTGEQRVRIVAYDAAYPNGLVVTDSFHVDVVGPC